MATALIQDRGFNRSRAIATAKNRVEHWCETGHDNNLKGNPPVSKAVQAAACKAIAEWKEKLGRAKAKNLLSEEETELLVEEFEPWSCPTEFGEDEEGALELEELIERIKDPENDAETTDLVEENGQKDEKSDENPLETAQNPEIFDQNERKHLLERINTFFTELAAVTVDAIGRRWSSTDHPRGAGGTFTPTPGQSAIKGNTQADIAKNLMGQINLGDLEKYRSSIMRAVLEAQRTGQINPGHFADIPEKLREQAVQVCQAILQRVGPPKQQNMSEASLEEIKEDLIANPPDGWEVTLKEGSLVFTELAEEFTDTPWDGSAARFKDTNSYCRSALIDENPAGEPKKQGLCHLPIKEPSGKINKGALRNAAARLNQVQASKESKDKARTRLSSLMKKAGMSTNLDEPLYQLPINLSETKESGGLWRKALVPVGKKILKGGKPLDFSRETLSRMVDNFKAKAYDQVPLLNGHTDSVDAYLGELVDLELDNNWLWGVFKPSKKGLEILKDNPKLPTSVGYWEDYTRPSDDIHFGPTLQHIAAIFRPHVPGLGKWEPVQLQEAAIVVDLTEAEFSAQDPRKERDPVSELETAEETREEVEVKPEEVKTEDVVSLEEFNALKEQFEAKLEEGREQFEAKLEEERQERLKESTRLRRQGIRKMLNEDYVSLGVPPAKTDAAFTLLSSQEGLVTLSEDGDASLGDSEHAQAIQELLEGYKGTLKFGEEGTSEGDGDIPDEQKVKKLAEDEGITRDEAYERLADEGVIEW